MPGTYIRRASFLPAGRSLLVAALLAFWPGLVGAQDVDAIVADQAARQAEYESVMRDMTLSADRLEQLSADIAKVRKDHATLTAALIQSAKTEKKLSQDIEDITGKLEGLKEQQEGIRVSLAERV